MMKRAALPAMTLVIQLTVGTTACTQVAQDSATGQTKQSGRRLYSVAEQERIAVAARVFWMGASKLDDWDHIALRTFFACGSPMDVDEAVEIARYHPRAAADNLWRGAFESALMRVGRADGNAIQSFPSCRLIRVAVGLSPVDRL